MSDLEEEGVAREALQKVYSPIGLNIGAEIPGEIAECILSELIKVHRVLDERLGASDIFRRV